MRKPTPERLAEFAQHLADYKEASQELAKVPAYSQEWVNWTRPRARAWSAVENLFGLSMTQTDRLMNEEVTPEEMWAEKQAKKVNA